jgi:hypothetical protein
MNEKINPAVLKDHLEALGDPRIDRTKNHEESCTLTK